MEGEAEGAREGNQGPQRKVLDISECRAQGAGVVDEQGTAVGGMQRTIGGRDSTVDGGWAAGIQQLSGSVRLRRLQVAARAGSGEFLGGQCPKRTAQEAGAGDRRPQRQVPDAPERRAEDTGVDEGQEASVGRGARATGSRDRGAQEGRAETGFGQTVGGLRLAFGKFLRGRQRRQERRDADAARERRERGRESA